MSLFSPTSRYYFVPTGNGQFALVTAPGLRNGQAGFYINAITVSENTNLYISVYRTKGATGPIQLNYATHDGTGTAGVDYTATSGTLTWADGDIQPKTIVVPITRTSSITNPTFTITLTNPGNFTFTIAPYATVTVTIKRDGHGELDFVGAAYSVQDPSSSTVNLVLQVQRFNGAKGAVGCSFHTTDGTALAGTDYTANSGTLSWADGVAGTVNITIVILSHRGHPDRNFTVTIDTPTGNVTIGLTNVATVTITDGSPSTNPSAGSSIPEQIDALMLEDGGGLTWKSLWMEDSFTFSRVNRLDGSMLGQKIGTTIGFGPATASGGTDNVNTDPAFIATPHNKAHVKRMGYKERV